MYDKLVSARDAAHILEMDGTDDLEAAVDQGAARPSGEAGKDRMFSVAELILFALARAIESIGVDPDKSRTYSEAVLSNRLRTHDDHTLEWVENEAQELFCLIADNQLARIFLRNKEDGKELDVGAVKPILFPVTKCEINVFRVVRPVLFRAREILEAE
jgi:hypothetical protein